MYVGYPILIAFACLVGQKDDPKETGWKSVFYAAVLCGAFTFLLIFSMFLLWNPVADTSGYLQGIQGRYFIPILPVLLLTLPILLTCSDRLYNRLVWGFSLSWVILLLAATIYLAQRYWA